MRANFPNKCAHSNLLSPYQGAQFSVVRPLSDVIGAFPATRYYGSKRRLLGWIYSHLKGLDFESALDAFGGTASVSLLLKAMRKKVTYHDGFRFNQDVGRTLLANKPALGRDQVIGFCDAVKPTKGVITRNFAGLYYLLDENCWLDGYMGKLAAQQWGEEEGALLRYLIYQACLKKRPFNLFHRANLHLRTKPNVKRSFGNAVTWERSFREHIIKAYDEIARSSQFESVPNENITILPYGDVTEISPEYDLVYLDPPYVSLNPSRNRDNYWNRYHFLEGLAEYEKWERRIDTDCPLRKMSEPVWFSDWASKATFKDRLFALLARFRSSTVALSYVTDAVPTFEEIKDEFSSLFRDVSIHSVEHNHALSGRKKRELLFIGRP